MNAVLALAISICLGVVGQLGLKAGALEDIGKRSLVPHPYIVLGLIFYAVAATFYIYALRKIPLSVAYPSLAVGYVAVAYLASLIWKEYFGWQQLVGLLAIGVGLVMLYQHSR